MEVGIWFNYYFNYFGRWYVGDVYKEIMMKKKKKRVNMMKEKV